MNALAKKLQLKEGKLHLVNAPATYPERIQPFPEGVSFADIAQEKPDHIHLFVRDSDELRTLFPEVSPLLAPKTVFWVMYPKKASGIDSDLRMIYDWPVLTENGYRPVGSAAIDENWTSLRFKPENQVKRSEAGSTAMAGTVIGEYIDSAARTVTLPGDVLSALKNDPDALAFFEQLAFTHKKEYVTWILTAKQEKTRLGRVEKMAGMLRAKQKNPSGK
ncbi:MAG: YdeI/OmpD-associated family protein [Mucilaginibacter polytrichastri]|nr:YdeI/OmpD-associated family protein [Mucilaginibacter polytrichastri]